MKKQRNTKTGASAADQPATKFPQTQVAGRRNPGSPKGRTPERQAEIDNIKREWDERKAAAKLARTKTAAAAVFASGRARKKASDMKVISQGPVDVIEESFLPEDTVAVKKPNRQRKQAAKAAKAPKPPKSPRVKKPAKASKKTSATGGGKGAKMIELISRPAGATIDEIMTETGWQAHSVRGFISTLGKKGNSIASAKNEYGVRFYKLTS